MDFNLKMIGTIVGIPGKYSCYWTISQDCNFAGSRIPKKYFSMEVMKLDSKVTEHFLMLVVSLTNCIQIQNTDTAQKVSSPDNSIPKVDKP